MFQGVPILFFPSFPIFSHLVGGFNHLEKYESQWEGLSHILWKKNMLQTTKQSHMFPWFPIVQVAWGNTKVGMVRFENVRADRNLVGDFWVNYGLCLYIVISDD